MSTDHATTSQKSGSVNRVEMRIPSDLIFERVVRAAAEEIGHQMNFSEERVADLTLVVSEAVTNAIEHGNRLQRDIHVGVVFAMEDDHLEVQVIDQGEKSPLPKIRNRGISEESLEQGQLRGLGLFLIHQLVDRIEFSSSEKGNTFTMWLHITEKNQDNPQQAVSRRQEQ